MLIGKVAHETMIVVDCSPLPVEGTETRVNAQVNKIPANSLFVCDMILAYF